jgi:hypothetical protein
VRARGNQAKSSPLKAGGEGFNVFDPELDFDFAVGSHADKYKERETIKQAAAPAEKAISAAQKALF